MLWITRRRQPFSRSALYGGRPDDLGPSGSPSPWPEPELEMEQAEPTATGWV